MTVQKQSDPQGIVESFAEAFWDDPGLFAQMIYDSGDHHNYDVDEALAIINGNPYWSALLQEGMEDIDLWRTIGEKRKRKTTALLASLEKQMETTELPGNLKSPLMTAKPEAKRLSESEQKLGENSLTPSRNMVAGKIAILRQQIGSITAYFAVENLRAIANTGLKKISNGLQWVRSLLRNRYGNMVQRAIGK